MPNRRDTTGHPRCEDRQRDRVRETRARSRVRRRRYWGTVDAKRDDRTDRGQKMPTWQMEDGAGASAEEPLTEELLHELLAAPSPVAFTEAHGITHRDLSGYLNQLLEEKGLKRADAVRAAGINETFGYQIFKGQRKASRDKVLQLAFALGCDVVETNRLLKAAGVNELYCKDRRDAIVLFCIDRGLGLQRADEELYRFGEDTLGA